ncbi:hypothetical protein B296_00026343, partial [Ensete ventricosum]
GLTKLLSDHAPNAIKEQRFENYSGRKIAIDASMSIYQFLVRRFRLPQRDAGYLELLLVMIGNSYDLEASDVVQVVVGRNGMETLTNEAGEVTRYLKREDAIRDLTVAIEVRPHT